MDNPGVRVLYLQKEQLAKPSKTLHKRLHTLPAGCLFTPRSHSLTSVLRWGLKHLLLLRLRRRTSLKQYAQYHGGYSVPFSRGSGITHVNVNAGLQKSISVTYVPWGFAVMLWRWITNPSQQQFRLLSMSQVSSQR